MLHVDTLLNGRYRILEPVGEGGMATVYRAQDTRLGRIVAVKVLHPEFARDQPFVQRFQQEAEFAASLGSHPNIVAIYDIGQDGQYHYIVQELVEGHTLKDLIRDEGPFPAPRAFAIGQQVASALDFAHKRGLIHRDIKPQNIIVTSQGAAKVTDFGIARSLSSAQLTRTGMVIGTVHYFSPEQAQGKPALPQSDIYSLGIILYEMLTGHLPFDAENAVGVAMQHLQSEPPSPWQYVPTLPAAAVAAVMRALEKDPERRYRDAAEFAGALASTADSAAVAGTTTLSPIVQPEPTVERTAVYQPVEATRRPAEPVRRTIVTTPPPVRTPAPTRPEATSSAWRPALIAAAALLLIAAVAAAAFFVVGRGAASPPATSTPTLTPPPTPKRVVHHRPTPTATFAVVVPPPATFTPTPAPIIPTATPRPKPPTPTPLPPPPTSTPQPQPTVEFLGPTSTATATG